MTSLEPLRSVMRDHGVDTADELIANGKLIRFTAKGDHGANSWLIGYDHGTLIIAIWGDWKRGLKERWTSRNRSEMSAEDWKVATESFKLAEEIRKAEEEKNHERVRGKCHTIFSTAPNVTSHPYLTRKGVGVHGNLRVSNDPVTPGWLAIPLQDEHGVIQSAQMIADDGTKRFLYQGRIAGCYFPMAGSGEGPIIVCEGYSTGASIHEATDWTVICAMSAGNLLSVAKSMRAKFKDRVIIIAADNDHFTEGNPGEKAATAAAKAIGATVALPQFADECLADHPTDFNDLHRLAGLSVVKAQIEASMTIRAMAWGELKASVENDPSELLRYRYLFKGGSLLINGSTGLGKSSFLLQAFAMWSLGLPFFGILPTRPLRCLLIQAENDPTDLVEIREGIATGCKLTKEQQFSAFHPDSPFAVRIITCNDRVGMPFCKDVLGPSLALYRPDLVALDPLNSYHGGDVNKQTDMGQFLRQGIQPLISASKSGSICTHHTNKPVSGKERPTWRNGEFAYLGAGSAELANWHRAVMSIADSGVHGLYHLHAAKRGTQLGWKNEAEERCFQKLIAHSGQYDENGKGIIYWREAPESELPDDGTRGKTYDPEKLLSLLGDSGLTTSDWREEAREQFHMSARTLDRAIADLKHDDRILKSKVDKKWKPIIKRPE